MKRLKSLAFSLILCIVSVLLLNNSATASPDPTQQLQPFLDRVIEVLSTTTDDEVGNKSKVDHVMALATEAFDFGEMSKRVLGRQWRTLTPEQKEQFEELFTELLKYAYVTQIDKYSDQEVKYVRQRIKGKRAQVETIVVDSDKEIPVSYIMLLKADKWRVYDVVVEGVSLIRNYLEQFQEILRKDDFEGLTHTLEKKVKEFQDGANVAG